MGTRLGDLRKWGPSLVGAVESTWQCRGHRFNPWSGKNPYAAGQLKPVCHNYWARVLQLPKPGYPGAPVLQQKKSLQWEAHTLQRESDPRLSQLEKACMQQPILTAAKNKKIIIITKKKSEALPFLQKWLKGPPQGTILMMAVILVARTLREAFLLWHALLMTTFLSPLTYRGIIQGHGLTFPKSHNLVAELGCKVRGGNSWLQQRWECWPTSGPFFCKELSKFLSLLTTQSLPGK